MHIQIVEATNNCNVPVFQTGTTYDTAAYKSLIETTHIKKYKDTVKDMVKSLKLIDVMLLAVAKKPGM